MKQGRKKPINWERALKRVEGLSVQDAAKKLRVSPSTIYARRIEAGAPVRRRGRVATGVRPSRHLNVRATEGERATLARLASAWGCDLTTAVWRAVEMAAQGVSDAGR